MGRDGPLRHLDLSHIARQPAFLIIFHMRKTPLRGVWRRMRRSRTDTTLPESCGHLASHRASMACGGGHAVHKSSFPCIISPEERKCIREEFRYRGKKKGGAAGADRLRALWLSLTHLAALDALVEEARGECDAPELLHHVHVLHPYGAHVDRLQVPWIGREIVGRACSEKGHRGASANDGRPARRGRAQAAEERPPQLPRAERRK